MDSTPRSSRCARPHCTNHSTDRYTASQLVWKARAVSRQLNRRAQRAKNPIMAQVTRRLLLTTRTAPAYAGMRLYGDLDGLRSLRAAKHSDLLVYEPYQTLHLIQDGLNL